MRKNNKGFTLIEMLIALLISSFVILGVSMMFKFVAINWLSQVKRFLYTQETGMLSRVINTQFENIYNINRRNFFMGDKSSFTFVTRDSGTFIPGITQVYYTFQEGKFRSCFKSIGNLDELAENIDEFDEDSCFVLEDVKMAEFNFLLKRGEDYSWVEEARRRIPSAILMKVEIKKQDAVIKKDIYAVAE